MANNWAIVIGINQYEHLPPSQHLQFAVQDAEKVKEFLCDRAGFPAENVLLCCDHSAPVGQRPISTRPARTNLRRLLLEHIQQASDADNFWFFFAGHGISINSQDYLLPCDGYYNDADSAIPFRFVVDRLRDCKPRNLVLILDMCRDGAAPSSSRGVGQDTEQITRQQGIITLFSCSPGQSSYEISELGHGAFTHTLLRGLEQSTILSQLETFMRREVPAVNRQHGKPIQEPLVVVEPGWKYNLPLLPECITTAEVNQLFPRALEAEAKKEYEIAKNLWWVVIQALNLETQNSRELRLMARDAIDRMDREQRLATNPASIDPKPDPLKPDPAPISSAPSKENLRIEKKWLWAAGGIAALLASGAVLFASPLSCQIFGGWIKSCPSAEAFNPLRKDYFSRGGTIMLEKSAPTECQVESIQQAFEQKRAGVEAFSRGNYSGTRDKPGAEQFFEQAVSLFSKGRGQDSDCPGGDPETLIYLNNLEAIASGQPLTIAISIPGGTPELQGIAASDLRGVAEAQKKFNAEWGNAGGGRKLQVLIAQDGGDIETAERVAAHLVRNDIPGDAKFQEESGQILGVIGHYTSDATLAAGEIYAGVLPAIAQTSTAVRTSGNSNSSGPFSYQFNLSPWVFRTAPNDAVAAQDLAERLPLNQRAVIVYHSQSIYSKSISAAFKEAIAKQKGEISGICDLAQESCETSVSEQLRDSAANVLMLAPRDIDDLKRVRNLIENIDDVQRSDLNILGGDVMYDPELFSLDKKALGIQLSVAWHRDRESTQRNSDIEYWGTRSINWTTASSYDAAQALIQALESAKSVTPQGVYDALVSSSFEARGRTGTVQFDQQHDRIVEDENGDRIVGVVVEVKMQCQDSDSEKLQFCLAR